jgi:hypothetical protein
MLGIFVLAITLPQMSSNNLWHELLIGNSVVVTASVHMFYVYNVVKVGEARWPDELAWIENVQLVVYVVEIGADGLRRMSTSECIVQFMAYVSYWPTMVITMYPYSYFRSFVQSRLANATPFAWSKK